MKCLLSLRIVVEHTGFLWETEAVEIPAPFFLYGHTDIALIPYRGCIEDKVKP